MVGNTLLKKKDIHKYTWMRQDNGRVLDGATMDYVVVSRNVMEQLLNVRVLRGDGRGISDHFLVEGKLRVGMRWVNRRVGEAKRVLKRKKGGIPGEDCR